MGRRAHLPARFPPHGAWPAMMRADMVAAFLDFEDTAALFRAVERGEAPRPSDIRRRGQLQEPVWDADACRTFARRRAEQDVARQVDADSVAALI